MYETNVMIGHFLSVCNGFQLKSATIIISLKLCPFNALFIVLVMSSSLTDIASDLNGVSNSGE